MANIHIIADSFINSFLGPNKCCKFIENNGSTEIVGCITSYLNEVENEHPISHIIRNCLNSHHEEFGCGTTSTFAMFFNWYRALNKWKNSGVNTSDLVEELENLLKEVIKHLREIVQSCSVVLELTSDNHSVGSVTGKGECSLKTANQSKMTALQLVKGISHGNEWACQLLTETWLHQINTNAQYSIMLDPTLITSTTMCAPSSSSCVYPGLLLKVRNDSAEIISQRRSRKALLINGSITHTFTHKGINLPSTFNKGKSVSAIFTCETEAWTLEVLGIVRTLNIDMLLTSGKVDENVGIALNQSQVAIVDNISAKKLEMIAKELGGSLAMYIKDCDESNVVDVNVAIDESFAFTYPRSSMECWVQLSLPKSIQTIVICHPVPTFSIHLEHSLWHQLYRLSNITISNSMLPGGCHTERFVVKHLECVKSTKNTANILANNILREGFDDYIHAVERNIGSSDTSPSTIDDYNSKINGWISALRLACLIAQMDYVITAGDFNDTKHFDQNHWLGNL